MEYWSEDVNGDIASITCHASHVVTSFSGKHLQSNLLHNDTDQDHVYGNKLTSFT